MWTCEQCETQIGDPFDVCWNCGTDVDGVVEPGFRHADHSLPELPALKRQFGLADLFLISNAVAFSLAGWKTQNSILFCIGVLVLALSTACWLVPRQFSRWQRRIRETKDDNAIDKR